MKKSLTLAMALALGITASAYAANPFSDVPAGHWAYDSVAKLAAEGVVDGYTDGAFAGDKLMTRYEMAQIVAKAMAKGADCDKLAAEFADELDSLGVRVAKLEKGADDVKITGEVRYHYADIDNSSYRNLTPTGEKVEPGNKFHENQLRTRIWVQGAINDDWTYTGMLQNTQDFDNETGDEETKFKRAYVEGKLGGLDVIAGRYNAYLVNGNLYDEHADGVEVSYGNDVKLTAFYMKPTDQQGVYSSWIIPEGASGTPIAGKYEARIEYGKAYGAKVDTQIGVVKATAGYTVFADGEKTQARLGGNGVDDELHALDDNKIWNVGVAFDIAKDLSLTADYLKSDLKKLQSKTDSDIADFKDDDGFILNLNYKGAKASEPGSYGFYAYYYDQARGTVIAHTMNGYHGYSGFTGYMLGANYTVAKNIVASLEWYDLESKDTASIIGGTSTRAWYKQDMQTLWAQVVFTF